MQTKLTCMFCDSSDQVEAAEIGPNLENWYRSENGIQDEVASKDLGPFGICAICLTVSEDERIARHMVCLKNRFVENVTEHTITEHGLSLEDARAYAEKTLPGHLEEFIKLHPHKMPRWKP